MPSPFTPATVPGSSSTASQLLYAYTVSGSDKASIDTAVDGSYATASMSVAFNLMEIMIYARTDEAAVQSSAKLTFNNDTGANYDRQYQTGQNAAVTAASAVAATGVFMGATGASALAGNFGIDTIWIPNYSGTVGNKTGFVAWADTDSVAANQAVFTAAFGYRSTSAITRVKIVPGAGTVFKVGSQLLIYAR